jgi:hypothetical protein
MINHPVFFIDDAASYLALEREKDAFEEEKERILQSVKGTNVSALGAELDKAVDDIRSVMRQGSPLDARGIFNFIMMTSSKIASPLEADYWSMVPYRLGDPPLKRKIKFRVRHVRPKEAARAPAIPSENFLRETMVKQLSAGAGPRQFFFEIQQGTPDMSVENSMVEWKEKKAKFKKVATITIPEQEFDTSLRHEFCEKLSFTPWHALPQHCPLGAVNRIRRVVYERISKVRHELNGKPRREPTRLDPEMNGA